MLMTELMG